MKLLQNVQNYDEKGFLLMEKRLGITQAREKFRDLVERVQYKGDMYIINRHGKPAAAVVPVELYESWKRQREEFFDLIREIQESNIDADPDQVMEDVLQAQQASRSSN
jgi:prevent-host-death family protein